MKYKLLIKKIVKDSKEADFDENCFIIEESMSGKSVFLINYTMWGIPRFVILNCFKNSLTLIVSKKNKSEIISSYLFSF